MRKGTTRIVFLIGNYAIKIPRFNRYKSIIRGLLANMDERMWYKSSTIEWKIKMAPSIFCFLGFILIQKRTTSLCLKEYREIEIDHYKPLPMDNKISNFGWYKGSIVLVDYADSRYFCSDCEEIFACKRNYN